MPILFVTLTTRTTNTHRKFVGAFAKNTEFKTKKKKNKKKAIGMPCSGYALPFPITISFVIGYIVALGWHWGPGHRHKLIFFNLEIGLIDFRNGHKTKRKSGYFRTKWSNSAGDVRMRKR